MTKTISDTRNQRFGHRPRVWALSLSQREMASRVDKREQMDEWLCNGADIDSFVLRIAACERQDTVSFVFVIVKIRNSIAPRSTIRSGQPAKFYCFHIPKPI